LLADGVVINLVAQLNICIWLSECIFAQLHEHKAGEGRRTVQRFKDKNVPLLCKKIDIADRSEMLERHGPQMLLLSMHYELNFPQLHASSDVTFMLLSLTRENELTSTLGYLNAQLLECMKTTEERKVVKIHNFFSMYEN